MGFNVSIPFITLYENNLRVYLTQWFSKGRGEILPSRGTWQGLKPFFIVPTGGVRGATGIYLVGRSDRCYSMSYIRLWTTLVQVSYLSLYLSPASGTVGTLYKFVDSIDLNLKTGIQFYNSIKPQIKK